MILKPSFYCFLLFLIIFSSCTLQKRVYRKGYYVHRNSVSPKKEKVSKEQINKPEINNSSVADEALFASNDKSFFVPVKVPLIDSVKKVSCGDSIWFSDGSVVVAKILEISSSQIKYKRCSNIDGPTIVVLTSSVSKIKYENGFVEEYEVKKPEKPETKPEEIKPAVKEESKSTKPPSSYAARMAFTSAGVLLTLLGLTIITAYYSPIAIVFGLLTLIAAIITWVLAASALRKIKKDPEAHTGQGMAAASLGVSIATTALFVLALVVLLIILFILLLFGW